VCVTCASQCAHAHVCAHTHTHTDICYNMNYTNSNMTEPVRHGTCLMVMHATFYT